MLSISIPLIPFHTIPATTTFLYTAGSTQSDCSLLSGHPSQAASVPPEGKGVNMKPLEEGRAFPPRDAVLPQTASGLTGVIA